MEEASQLLWIYSGEELLKHPEDADDTGWFVSCFPLKLLHQTIRGS
jgi:hypothetical protein